MIQSRAIPAVTAALLFFACRAFGQNAPADTTPASAEFEEQAWALSACAFAYFVPNDDDFLMPIVAADLGRLHLEARYNYEDLDTGSAWIGFNLDGGNELTWEFAPMLGAVFGNTDGIAPGYNGTLGWRRFELYSEGEYLFDAEDSDADFFYNWSELTFAPAAWYRLGLVVQRTRVYKTEREVQRGLIAGIMWRSIDVAACLFNPDDEEAPVALALTWYR